MQIQKQGDDFFKNLSDKQRFWHGAFMWAVLFLAYMVFCFNWLVMGKLEKGWSGYFFGEGGASELVKNSVDYVLLFSRGFAMVWVAWITLKLSHKKAVVISLFLQMACIFLPFVPKGHFWLFVVGRSIMALGGTMSIIFIQPVLAKFFNLQQKAVFSILNSFAYVIGALMANFIFLNPNMKNWMIGKWEFVVFIASITSIVPFFLYWVYGKNFETSSSQQNNSEDQELPQNTYLGIIKEKSSWFWIIWYSFLLVASVSISNTVPNKIVAGINKDLFNAFSSDSDGMFWKSIYTIIFYLGCFFGFFLGRWNKTKFQRKPFVMGCCFLGFLFWLFIFLTLILSKGMSNKAATGIIFASVFLFSFFSMGIQTVILYIPHEYSENKNAKRISIFFSYLWGMGYMVYGIYYIIISSLLDIGKTAGSQEPASKGCAISLLMFTVLIACFAIFSLYIKEPRPTWKIHPWDKKDREAALRVS